MKKNRVKPFTITVLFVNIKELTHVPVVHTCNPSYAGGRNQEDHGSKLAQANSSLRPYLEKTFRKIGLVEWCKMKAMSSSLSTAKKKHNRTCITEEPFKCKKNFKVVKCSMFQLSLKV
jgi:hypothetical protein